MQLFILKIITYDLKKCATIIITMSLKLEEKIKSMYYTRLQ